MRSGLGRCALTWKVEDCSRESLPTKGQGDTEVTICFTADVLPYSRSLGPGSVDDLVDLFNRNGFDLELLPERGPGQGMTKSLRSTRIDSYLRQGQRPRPSLVGYQRGSVLVLRSKQPLSAEDLKRLRMLGLFGIGLRTGEGFGRFVVNPDFLKAESVNFVSGDTAIKGGQK